MNETGLRVQEKVLTFFIRRYAMLVIAMGLSLTALSLDAIQAHDGNGLYDDFSSGELDRTLWDMSQAGDTAKLTEIDGNNALHITGEQNDYVSIGFKDTEVNNATVFEAKIRIADFGTRDGVISFNLMSENPGHASGYSALMSARGGFLAERNGSFEGLPSSQSTPFSLKKDQWHTVRFELENKELTLTVDGTVVHVAEVEGNQSGKPVFIIDRGMEVFIDDVHVGHPSDETVVLAPTSTPEVVGTPEHTPTPELLVIGTLRITTPTANIRSGASRTGDLLLSAQAGQEFQVVGVIEDGERIEGNTVWYEVVLPEEEETGASSRRGFISATLVEYTRDERVADELRSRAIAEQRASLVLPEDLAKYNTQLRFRSYMDREFLNDAPWTSEYVTGTANWDNMDLLLGEGGERIAAGIYTDPETFPLDRELFEDTIYINGVEIEQALVIGQVVAIGRTYGENPQRRSIVLYVAVPEEGTNRANVLSSFVIGDVSRLLAVDSQGNYTGSPRAADDNGYIARGTNPNSSFVWDGNNGSPFEFPAGNGEIVRVTTQVPVAVFFAMNPAKIGGHGEQVVHMSEGRNPDEWINDWRNGRTDQAEEVTVYPVGIVFPTNTTTGTNSP